MIQYDTVVHRLEFQSHFYTLEDCFILTNGADPGEMPHLESFYLGFHTASQSTVNSEFFARVYFREASHMRSLRK